MEGARDGDGDKEATDERMIESHGASLLTSDYGLISAALN